jgi:hypothetical protein
MKVPKTISVSIFGSRHESDAPPDTASLTVEQLNEALRPHGRQLPADPTPAQLDLARFIFDFDAERQAEATARHAEDERLARLAQDPDRKAAYDAARAACRFDTETLFPGWVPQPLTPNQQADVELVSSLISANEPSWSRTDPPPTAPRGSGRMASSQFLAVDVPGLR